MLLAVARYNEPVEIERKYKMCEEMSKEVTDQGNKDDDLIQVSAKHYQDLIRDSRWLECLENAGIDNWDGYDYAQEEYFETYGDDDVSPLTLDNAL